MPVSGYIQGYKKPIRRTCVLSIYFFLFALPCVLGSVLSLITKNRSCRNAAVHVDMSHSPQICLHLPRLRHKDQHSPHAPTGQCVLQPKCIADAMTHSPSHISWIIQIHTPPVCASVSSYLMVIFPGTQMSFEANFWLVQQPHCTCINVVIDSLFACKINEVSRNSD